MSRLDRLVSKSNAFSKEDISDISQHLFNVISMDYDKIDNSMKSRYQVLDSLINALNKTLYSNLIQEKEDKVKLVLTINQLKLQKELFELINSENFEEERQKLIETAERFGKKSQSSVAIERD